MPPAHHLVPGTVLPIGSLSGNPSLSYQLYGEGVAVLPDPSNWDASAEYDYADDLTSSDLAWEWLRRNEAYDRDYQALAAAEADVQSLTDRIRQHWRLFYPARSSASFSRSVCTLAA